MFQDRAKFIGYCWNGIVPPQYIFSKRIFKKVVLEPPDLNPGSWRGAGKVLIDVENKTFWLTTRPRRAHPIRGYAVEIFKSSDGENYALSARLSKEQVGAMAGIDVRSIEGQQLLKDALTGRYHLYLAINVEGGWDTLLLTAEHPEGEWKCEGIVIGRGDDYDSREARDAIIDIIDGLYFALYKANDGKKIRMALATSKDGIVWRKHGILKVDGGEQPDFLLLSGRMFRGSIGPIFMGTRATQVIDGASVTDTFVAYWLDHRNLNIESLFSRRWEPLSPYERKDYPIHTYMDLAYDPFKDRFLIYIEAIDPKDIGLNKEVDRVILYEVPL